MKSFILNFKEKHPKWFYVLMYTLIFALCAVATFCYFGIEGKSFVWSGTSGYDDGLSQHYVALTYYGSYLRGIVRSLFSGNFSVPLYDTTIGMGGDVLTTLHYYCMGDPLALFSVFVPRAYTEYLFAFLILLRLYLAGLAFSLYMNHVKRNNGFFTLIGSLVYVFSGYILFAAVRHPYFTNPLIYLPLILLGAEYIFEKRKPYLFILSVGLAGICNFYFFYMLCAVTAIYVLIRMMDFVKRDKLIQIWSYLWRFGLYAIVGVLISCITFLPLIITLLTSVRAEQVSVNLLYPTAYYKNLLASIPSSNGPGYWSYISHLPISFFALILLWMGDKKHLSQKVGLVVCTVMFSLPIVGHVLNGFSYIANRWSWGYSFLLAIIVAVNLEKLTKLTAKRWWIIVGITVLYGVFALDASSAKAWSAGVYCLWITLAVISLVYWILRSKQCFKIAMKSAILLLTIFGVMSFGYERYHLSNYIRQFADSGELLNNSYNAQGRPLNNLNDTSYYRYDDYTEDEVSYPRNSSLLNGGHSTNHYWSLTSPYMCEMLRSLGSRHIQEQLVYGLDGKTILTTLANVKYVTGPTEKAPDFVPYGYAKEALFTASLKNHRLYRYGADENELPATVNYSYYKNENFLPFGYTYDSYITREEYDKLSYNDRQQAMLQSAVLEQATDHLSENTALNFQSHAISFDIDPGEKVLVTENGLLALEGKQTIRLKLKNAVPSEELYLNFKNLVLTTFDETDLKNAGVHTDVLSDEEKSTLLNNGTAPSSGELSNCVARADNNSKRICLFLPKFNYYNGAQDYAVNLGCHDTAVTEITLYLYHAGQYCFDSMEVEQIGMDGYEDRVAKLADEHLENVEFSTNRLDGTITVSQNKLLCISLPYSTGWTAYVDGKQTEIKQTDIGFMGVELTPGQHTITLTYCTPYLKFSALMSGLGILAFAVIVIVINMKKKKKESK